MISQELQEIYSNYDENRMFYDSVQLYHPNFVTTSNDFLPSKDSFPSSSSFPGEFNDESGSFYLIKATENKTLKLEDGTAKEFLAYPFELVLPEVGSTQQDIGLTLDNVSLTLINSLEAASLSADVPIKMTYRVYIDGDDENQITPITLTLTNITVDGKVVSCVASRVDLFKRKFPFGKDTYFDYRFKGLFL